MTPDLEMAIPPPVPTAENPFALGWRYTGLTGGDDWRRPLTEYDLVFPEEGDFVVNNLAHEDNRQYLAAVLRQRIAGRPGLRVFSDHLIDFQHPAVPKALGPDVILLNGEEREWDPNVGVFPVVDMGARPLITFEITSPSTRRVDVIEKMEKFHLVGVPVYVLIDLSAGGARRPLGIVAYQAGPTEYEALPPEPDGRVWLEVVEVFLAEENNRVVCYDLDGVRIPDYSALVAERDAAEARAAAAAAEAQRLRDELAALRARLSPGTDTPSP